MEKLWTTKKTIKSLACQMQEVDRRIQDFIILRDDLIHAMQAISPRCALLSLNDHSPFISSHS